MVRPQPYSRCPSALLLAVALWPHPVNAQQPQYEVIEETLSSKLATRFFEEAKALSEKDAGRLWGIPLYGPLAIVDPNTRTVIANRADREGYLKKSGNVFIGTLPAREIIASTAMSWAGVRWTVLAWPLPRDEDERAHLIAHEMWHRIQDQLGLPAANPANRHLDTRDGRIWMRLEWRALQAALRQSGAGRRQAVADALTFRAHRRSLFSNAATEERGLEMNEGLAEYTGVRVPSDSEAAAMARTLKNLRAAETWDSYVRSFAYASGPAYGILLDGPLPGWRKGLRPDDDLGQLLQEALSVSLPANLEAEAAKRAARYGDNQIIGAESEREKSRQKRLAEYRRRFIEGPLLIIPLARMNVGFNPLNLEPLDDLGTVYPTMTVTDEWGVLKVTGGALLNTGWTKVTVPAPSNPDASPLRGDGWALELKEGWGLRPGARGGDHILVKTSRNR